jgi:hypothetical protein
MATKKKTLTPPVLGSLNTVPVGGIENDPLRRVLAQIIAGAPSYGPASKPVLACVSALEDAQQIRWQIADGFQSKMQYEAITQQGARSVLAQGGSPIDDDEAARRLEAARQAIVGGIGDEYRDAFFATYQRFVDSGARVESTIAKGEADADTFESLRSDDKRQLVDLLRAQELRSDVFGRPAAATLSVLHRAVRAGDSDAVRRLIVPAEARALQIMRMSLDDLAKEIAGVATDDAINKLRETAMRLLSFCTTYRAQQRPEWIDVAKEVWGVLDAPRRQLFGPSIDYLAPGATSPDRGFSVAKWLDWKTLESDAHIRFLSWPVRLAGWSPATMQDHRPGAKPGQVVRANPVPTVGPFRFGAQPGGR